MTLSKIAAVMAWSTEIPKTPAENIIMPSFMPKFPGNKDIKKENSAIALIINMSIKFTSEFNALKHRYNRTAMIRIKNNVSTQKLRVSFLWFEK